MTTLRDIRERTDLLGKRVLLRASLDEPINERGELADDFRLRKTLPTIEYLVKSGAKVIVCGHLGRDPHISFEPIMQYFQKHIRAITFAHDVVGPPAKNIINNMKEGDVVLLENLRREDGETENDETFARDLASLADIYVNDAFSVAHRVHASIVGVPEYIPGYAGLQFIDEYEQLEYARRPKHPALFILGGAKMETKEPLINKFLSVYDHVFVGGALANDFFRAEGFEVGRSLLSHSPPRVKHLLGNQRLILPSDVVVLTGDGKRVVRKIGDVQASDCIYDAGPATFKALEPIIRNAEFILWNGPLGEYKHHFFDGTKNLIDLIGKAHVDAVVGGGDTMSLISKFDCQRIFSFCSTAGGAMLEFLLKGTLPGIEAIQKSQHQ